MTPRVNPPEVDVDSGLLAYSTVGGRHRARLRTTYGDFQVEELLEIKELRRTKENGLVPVYRVTKTGVDTPHVAREISDIIKSEVNFAGLKDSNAVVVQHMSARSTRALSPAELKGKRFEAKLMGFSKPITRSMLIGNGFKIFVETAEDLGSDIESGFDACTGRRVANFFGYQRFGLRSRVNRRAGKAIVEKDFESAVGLILTEPREGEDEEVKEARRLFKEERYADALPFLSSGQDIERGMASHLSAKPGDHLGALRRIPIPIRRLLVNSYQGYLFNLTVSRALEEGLDFSAAMSGDNWASVTESGLLVGRVHGAREDVPSNPPELAVPLVQIVGYAYRNYGSRFDRLLAEVLEEEQVSPARFYIKEADEMSNEGGFRHAPLLCRDLSFRRDPRGFLLEFSLGKGEYATVVLREILKPEQPQLEGF
ncbi:MAG: tRNA pseudouridine(13) synthase TruD [Thaumarchaeota archaeon]|nr:tRNA pseudouridine(13) synthase TruD [Nitrososphaerota archaeon]